MSREQFFEFFGNIIIGGFVEGFHLEGQFPVLEIYNEKEKVTALFHIDCKIKSNKSKINSIVDSLKELSEDRYDIGYLLAINLKKIIDLKFDAIGNLNLFFENDLTITFKLIDEWVEPLNISLEKDKKYIMGIRFINNGDIIE